MRDCLWSKYCCRTGWMLAVTKISSSQGEQSMKRTLQSFLMICSMVMSTSLIASGGGGFNTGGFSSQRIDQQYELGKSYFKSGLSANGSRLEYCVQSGDGLKKLSRRTVRQYKNGTVSQFVDNLFHCSDPTLKIADAVPEDQGNAILYYLNKRFKLRLQNG